jgi:hypothetical protein
MWEGKKKRLALRGMIKNSGVSGGFEKLLANGDVKHIKKKFAILAVT